MSPDDEIIAKLNASENILVGATTAFVVSLLLLAIFFLVAVHTGYGVWLESDWLQIAVAVLLGGAVLLLLIRALRDKTPLPDEDDPRFVRHRIDIYHRRWRWQVLLVVFTAFIGVFPLTIAISKVGPADRIHAVAAGVAIVFMIALFQTAVMVGPTWAHPSLRDLLDDEFVRALRARCARIGYLTQTLALAAIYLIAIARPDLTLCVLAWALYAGFAIPALYYVIADWRASRENDGRDG